MPKMNVLFDGNGSAAILVQGRGHYVPVDRWAEVAQERDQMAAKAAALDALIVAMQDRAALYLQPDGEPDANFISYILPMLDGPEQRAAQADPVQCLANVRADAIEAASNALYNAGIADEAASDWLVLYAAKVRGGQYEL